MNSKLSKTLRGHAGGRTALLQPAQYEKPELHHVTQMPVYEQHTRTIREMGANGCVIERQVTKTKFTNNGREPILTMVHNIKLGFVPSMEVVPVSKPRRLLVGSARAEYQWLKRHPELRGVL